MARDFMVSLQRKRGIWSATVKRKSSPETRIKARVVIDATELGDVAAMLGVPSDIGMESRELTGEDIAPEQANGIIQDLTYVATMNGM